ncbi:DUF945 family protein [Caviibacterium pharyngocola]|uniref:DUF945 family protein n=1 Tax=Caviibacterium pharyngocola TaxID=28159 RepID=UPI003C2B8D5D
MLNAVVTMGYDQRLKGDFRSDLTHQTEHNKFEWILNGRFEADEKGYGKAEVAIPTAMLRDISGEDQNTEPKSAVKNSEVLLNNAKVSWDIMPSGEFQHLINGRTHFIADSLRFKGEDDKGKVQNEIKKMDLTLSQKEDQGLADIAVAYGFGDWIHQGVSFGNGNLALQFNHLNAKALHDLLEDIRKKAETDWLKAGDGALNTMLNDSPQIKLSTLDLNNLKGNLHADERCGTITTMYSRMLYCLFLHFKSQHALV